MEPIIINHYIPNDQQGQYLLIPFEMPAGIERLDIAYTYERYLSTPTLLEVGQFTSRTKVNAVDIGLIAPDGSQVGASGSSRNEFFISETTSSPGYHPAPLTSGTWQILLGAYVIAPEGVDVRIQIKLTSKTKRWFKGDLHTHTFASDGILSLEHLARHALAHGLDFIAVTDHNQPIKRASFPKIEGFTLIPGLEWTHYQGHANFLGVEEPYQGSFYANTEEEARSKFSQARKNGALISLNHPLESNFGFHYDLEELDYDLIEVWNGPMRPKNIETVVWWDQMLKSGRKQVAVCGSDYHQDTIFQRLANPTINVLAWSKSETDILEAVRAGRSYFTYSPTELHAQLTVGESTYGDTVTFEPGLQVQLQINALEEGDQVRIITQDAERLLLNAPEKGDFSCSIPIERPGYLRLEIWRTFFSILPSLPALISNPIWFA